MNLFYNMSLSCYPVITTLYWLLVGATLNLKVVTEAEVNSISHSTLSVVETSYTDACTNWLPIEWVTGIEVKVPFPIVPLNVNVVVKLAVIPKVLLNLLGVIILVVLLPALTSAWDARNAIPSFESVALVSSPVLVPVPTFNPSIRSFKTLLYL